jgi:rubrerythrin
MPTDRPVQAQLIAQIRYAIEDERQAFWRYSEAAKLARDPKVEELLRFLAHQEHEHEAKLMSLLDEIESAPPATTPPPNSQPADDRS